MSQRLPQEPLSLREFLLQLHGIGYKTASWIVRNFTGSDDVAIVDIHLRRAGVIAASSTMIGGSRGITCCSSKHSLGYALAGAFPLRAWMS